MTWLDLLAVAVVTAAVFAPVLHGQFSPLDDTSMIEVNPAVTTPTWDNFAGFWTAPAFRIYMPLTLSVWQLVAALTHTGAPLSDGSFVVTPTAFKAVNIAAHALAAAAAAWTLSTLTRTRWPAVLGALVFAVHPVQAESVAWTTGLKDVLCGLFSILAVGFYARHARRDPPSPWADRWWWAAAAATLLAMASKSTGAVLPAALLAVDFATRRASVARRVVSVAPLALPAVAAAMVIVGAQGDSRSAVVPLWQRPLVAADAYAFYLRKIVWPGALAIDYGRRPSAIVASGAIAWTWLIPAAAFVGVLLTRSRAWLLAAALFVVPVLPVSGLASFDMQQFSTVTDHYLYQSMLGVGLAVALLTAWRPATGLAATLAVGVAAVLTFRECLAWQNVERLYARVLVPNPKSWMAYNLLGTLAAERGDLFTARRLSDRSAALSQDNGVTLDLQFYLAVLNGDYERAVAYGTRTIERLQVQRLTTARRMTMLGVRLNRPDVAEKGLRYWREVEPTNGFVVRMLRDVRQAQRAASRPATTRPGATP